ncbi:hypothetical protein L2D14_10485 [Thalassospiraceae bacterium LMO-JJ14]|nr:hypothetical protein L2D14_10485 [Thalassospiraceae bacterium LMO-JJ14]
MKKYKFLAVLLGAVLLSGCAVVAADENGISIRHSAENNLLVQRKAEKHCASFGKIAVKVQESSIMNLYYVRTSVSTFECVKKAPKPPS